MAIEEIWLTKEQQNTLEALGPDIEALERELTKCERAGIDVTERREDLKKAKALRAGILKELVKPGG